ncbi:MAG TPA: ferrous iron transport protein B [Bacteriovoracaceae bacterium]|nr:ferrous iron transport protein B [Bacteriovoracaceae bacterium]
MSLKVALVGMPNVGKTALFNKLTGSFQRVANFSGITVEKKSASMKYQGKVIGEVVDLPGIYSLDATTLDEKVTKDFLLQKQKEVAANLFVLVLDATNLDRSLFLAVQLKKLGYPLLIALNLIDEARRRGLEIDLDKLSSKLGARIIPTSAATGEGVEELKRYLFNSSDDGKVEIELTPGHQKLFRSVEYVSDVFNEVDSILKDVVISPLKPDTLTQRVDRILLHPVWGVISLIAILVLTFQLIFTWAAPLQDGVEAFFGLLGEGLAPLIGNDILRSLIVDGLISGVGGVLVFLPQIMILFLMIQFLEDIGYLGRATFLLDGLMKKLGLPGKAVLPLLSSHACAIPGIMATRVIDNPKDRLITMLVIPLTTCSARLPVFAVLIGAIVPSISILGLNLQGLVLFALYAIGFVSALLVAFVFKKYLPQTSPSMLLMELPPYRIPKIKNLIMVMLNKGKIFLKKAGGIILIISMVVWALISFPQHNGEATIEDSYAAMIGRTFEPVFKPLGFDWRITTALIPAIGAREVVVSALSMVFAIDEEVENFEESMSQVLVNEFGIGTLMALMVWFIFAPQCISTFAILKRETQSYKWPWVMVGYTFALAYFFSFLVKSIIEVWF